jgi:hypothetical protein
MNIEEAEALHVELLQNLPGTGDATSALSAVVELHAPKINYTDRAVCSLCPTWREESAPWPCATIAEVNAYAHVAGIPAGLEAWFRA